MDRFSSRQTTIETVSNSTALKVNNGIAQAWEDKTTAACYSLIRSWYHDNRWKQKHAGEQDLHLEPDLRKQNFWPPDPQSAVPVLEISLRPALDGVVVRRAPGSGCNPGHSKQLQG